MLRRPKIRSFVLSALMMSGLSACFPRPYYGQLPDPSVIQVNAVSEQLVIADILAPTKLEKSRTQSIFGTSPNGVRVRIRLPEGRPAPNEQQLRDAMAALGIPAGIAALSGQTSGSDRTILVIYHLTAEAPDCDSMVTPSEAISAEKRPQMAFGCATYSNLAGMVADPADLAGGRTFSGSDAADVDAAVTRFHDDKVKELRTTTSSVSGSKSN